MAPKPFYEILVDEIEAQVRADVAQSGGSSRPETQPGVHQPSPRASFINERLEAWLATHVERVIPGRGRSPRQAYGIKKSSSRSQKQAAPEPATIEIRVRASGAEALCAVELLGRTSGIKLQDTFSESELKTAWRRAALQSHPDRFTGADPALQTRQTELFRELALAYDLLSQLFDVAA